MTDLYLPKPSHEPAPPDLTTRQRSARLWALVIRPAGRIDLMDTPFDWRNRWRRKETTS